MTHCLPFGPENIQIGGCVGESIMLDFSNDHTIEICFRKHGPYTEQDLKVVRDRFLSKVYNFGVDPTLRVNGELADTILHLRKHLPYSVCKPVHQQTEVVLESYVRTFEEYRTRRRGQSAPVATTNKRPRLRHRSSSLDPTCRTTEGTTR